MPAPSPNPVPRRGIPHHGHLIVTRRDEEGAIFIGFVDGAELKLGEGTGVAWADYGDLTSFGGGGGGYGCHSSRKWSKTIKSDTVAVSLGGKYSAASAST